VSSGLLAPHLRVDQPASLTVWGSGMEVTDSESVPRKRLVLKQLTWAQVARRRVREPCACLVTILKIPLRVVQSVELAYLQQLVNRTL